MAALSVLTLAMVLLALRPRVAVDLLLGLHRIERTLERVECLTWPSWPRRRRTGPGYG